MGRGALGENVDKVFGLGGDMRLARGDSGHLLDGLGLSAAEKAFAKKGGGAEGAKAHTGLLEELAAGDEVIFETWFMP